MASLDGTTTENRRPGTTLAACCAVHAWQDGLTSTVNVVLPLLAQAFGLSYAQVGVVKAANLAAMAVLEIPSGLLSERFGTRLLLIFGLCAVGAGYLWLSAAGGFAAILLSLCLAGIGAAFQHTLSSALIAGAYRGRGLRPALGTYNASGDVGKLALTGAFTLALGLGVGWQDIVRGYGAGSIVLALAVLVLLFRGGVGGRLAAAAHNAARSAGWGVRHKPAFAGLCAINFLDSTVQAGFLTFVAFLMIERGVDLGLATFAVVLTLAGGVVGKFACGFLAARMGIIRSLILVEVLTAAGIVAVVVLPPLPALAILPVIGAFLQGSSSITYGSVTEFFEADRQARGFSLIYTTSNVASIVAALALGLVGDHFGISVTMLVMAVLTLLPLPLCGLLRAGLTEPSG